MGRTVALVKKECYASSMVLAEHQVIIRASLGAAPIAKKLAYRIIILVNQLI